MTASDQLFNDAVRKEFAALGEWARSRAYDPSVNPYELAAVLRERLAALRTDIEQRG